MLIAYLHMYLSSCTELHQVLKWHHLYKLLMYGHNKVFGFPESPQHNKHCHLGMLVCILSMCYSLLLVLNVYLRDLMYLHVWRSNHTPHLRKDICVALSTCYKLNNFYSQWTTPDFLIQCCRILFLNENIVTDKRNILTRYKINIHKSRKYI